MSRWTMRRFGVVRFGDGSVECDVAEVGNVGMIELEYRFEVVAGGDSGSDGVVWYSAGRPREVTIEASRVIGKSSSPVPQEKRRYDAEY
jgi:hypothetical protein